MDGQSNLLTEAEHLQDRTVHLRRRLHRRPELGLQLPETQAAILAELADLDLDVRTGTSVSSVVAVLEGAHQGPTYLLRGDMDALPLTEDTGLDFSSEIPGAMHACGHDTHVAMLASAARILVSRRDEIAGRVIFMFQPGEEGFHGARYMLEEGLLSTVADAPVSTAFALHISSTFASGTVYTRGGPFLASEDRIEITLSGRGGHASAPHHANDPIPAACEIALALQTMVTRRVDVFDPAVVTIGTFAAGTTHNIIPPTATLRGTMRTLSASTRAAVRDHVRRICAGIAAAHDLGVTVELTPATQSRSTMRPLPPQFVMSRRGSWTQIWYRPWTFRSWELRTGHTSSSRFRARWPSSVLVHPISSRMSPRPTTRTWSCSTRRRSRLG